MAGKKVSDIEIITPEQVNPLGVPAALQEGNTHSGTSPYKQKIRPSEVVIIVLLILLTLCCCCVCLGSVAMVKSLALWLGGLFGGSLAVPPLVF
jgi:hypothetical protein